MENDWSSHKYEKLQKASNHKQLPSSLQMIKKQKDKLNCGPSVRQETP